MTMNILTTKQCNSAIANIKITGKALDQAIQDVGLSVLYHCGVNREVSLANKLLNAMPKGGRRNALVEWLTTFGMVTVNLDRESAKTHPLLFNRDGATDLEAAAAKPWWTCRPERPAHVEFNFAAKMTALLKQAQTAIAAGQHIAGMEELDRVCSALGVVNPAKVPAVIAPASPSA